MIYTIEKNEVINKKAAKIISKCKKLLSLNKKNSR